MRLWSLHPRHLDGKALVAVWREGLLARAVLRGATRGYRRHPQLDRFRDRREPIAALDGYLHAIVDEAAARGYLFDRDKLGPRRRLRPQTVADGQLAYEWAHLLAKLRVRDRARWRRERALMPLCHPAFRVVAGGVAPWERPSTGSTRAGGGPRPTSTSASRRPASRRASSRGSSR
jgi:hypothetical protein